MVTLLGEMKQVHYSGKAWLMELVWADHFNQYKESRIDPGSYVTQARNLEATNLG